MYGFIVGLCGRFFIVVSEDGFDVELVCDFGNCLVGVVMYDDEVVVGFV